MTLPLLPLLVAASLAAADDPAFDAPHLTPVSWRVAPGEAVGAVLPPDAADDVEWLFFRAAGRQENRDAATPDADGAVSFVAPATDCCLIGLDRRPRVVTMDPAAFVRFQLRRGIAGRAPDSFPRTETIRVRLVESMKLLVRVAPEDVSPVPSATAQSKTGQAVELRPLADPTTVPIGSVLPVKVYGAFDPAGAIVVARQLESGARARSTADGDGVARVTLSEGGPWSVTTVDARALRGDEEADVEVRWASLTFHAVDAEETATPPSNASGEGER